MRRLWQRIQRLRPYRAFTRFGEARGNILSAGVAYFAFFSVFPAAALAATVFGFVLQSRPELVEAVGRALNDTLPGFVRTPGNPSGIIELKAPPVSVLTLTGVVALVGLLNAGVGWVGAVRDGVRAIFGVEGRAGNLVSTKLRDLGVLVGLGASLLLSAVLTSVVGGAASWLAELVGLGGHPVLVTVVGLTVGLSIDTAVVALLLRTLSGVRLSWRDVRVPSLVGGLGLTVLKYFGGVLIQLATRNPVFGSIVVVVGLLFWLNLIAKLILLAAAWAANDVDDARARRESGAARLGPGGDRPAGAPAEDGPAHGAPLGVPGLHRAEAADRLAPGIPSLGVRSQDRAVIAAGAVLGAAAAVLTGAAARLARSVFVRR